MTPKIAIPYDKVAAFCRKNHIKRLSLFGSVLREDFTEDSDVDVLVEFEEGETPGWDFFRMQDDLSAIVGRKVDLQTYDDLSKYFRDEVVVEAVPLYDKAG